MYKNKSQSSLFDVAIPAMIGAGIVTTLAIAQGQHPAMGLAITGISTAFAVICHRFDLI